MNPSLAPTEPQRALWALSGVVGALAAAEALGAPSGPLTAALGHLTWFTARIRSGEHFRTPLWRSPPSRKPRRQPRAPRARQKPVEAQEAEETASAWDPDTPHERLEVGRCRALLLEVVRRAIHDWILYRNHSNIVMRRRAESAYIWLFEEAPGHPWWRAREQDGHTITAFLTICEALDLEPDYVREKARQTTVKQIMTSGRPAEKRKPNRDVDYEEHGVDEGSVSVSSLDMLDQPRGSFTSEVEAHFASYTPDYA